MTVTPQDMLQWNLDGLQLQSLKKKLSCILISDLMVASGPCAWVPLSIPPHCTWSLGNGSSEAGLTAFKFLQPKWKLSLDMSPSLSDYCLSLTGTGSHGPCWADSLCQTPEGQLKCHQLPWDVSVFWSSHHRINSPLEWNYLRLWDSIFHLVILKLS